jgi:glycosyltransferase involved in cell wall biosynthesis
MISILILTYNEEVNLPQCLESVSWSDDVLVLDSFSTDRTMKIATAHGAKVLQNRFSSFAEQRNFGLAQGSFKYDWVLHLDADEMVTSELKDEMLAAIKRSGKNAYRLASKMMFRGKWLKHAALYPCYQVRLGKRDDLSFTQTGHGQCGNLPPEQVGTLKQPLIHKSFSKGIQDWLERHNRYSTAEAQYFCSTTHSIDWSGLLSSNDAPRRHRAMKELFAQLPFRPALRFLYMYVARMGFLDGGAGFTYCRLLSIYEYLIALKIGEIRRRQNGEPL